jgi:hypothetical protein
MKKALIVGAQFAAKMNSSSVAESYLTAMKAINSTLYSTHYNGAFYQESYSRTRDAAVIVAFNDAFDELDKMMSPTSFEVAQTVSSYNTMFCNEYSINSVDTNKGIPGVLYGRELF